jgi:hypothetical protein
LFKTSGRCVVFFTLKSQKHRTTQLFSAQEKKRSPYIYSVDVRLKILVKESFGYIHLFRWEEKTIEWNKLYSLINNSYCLYPDVSWETHPSLLARVWWCTCAYVHVYLHCNCKTKP